MGAIFVCLITAYLPLLWEGGKPNDQIVVENGSSMSGIAPLPLPDGAQVHSQSLWGSIGWATGAALGIAVADRARRTILFTGEGSHQMTAAAGAIQSHSDPELVRQPKNCSR